MTTELFEFTGSADTFDVPTRVFEIVVDMAGAGATGVGGDGARVQQTIETTPGETLEIRVGGENDGRSGGYNGGGNGHDAGDGRDGSGGAGASDIRQNGTSLSDRILVAGGGGGQSGSAFSASRNSGGNAGFNGSSGGGNGTAGSGGTQTDGGSSGGSLGDGGNGSGGTGNNVSGGGGGGGGFYGGGAGGTGFVDSGEPGGGGGGGSSLAAASSNVTTGFQTGNGYVELTYTPVPLAPGNVAVEEQPIGALQLTWTDPTEADQIEIYRSTNPDVDTSEDALDTVAAGVEAYADDSVLQGRTYYYRVVAVNDGGRSDDSTEVSETTTLPAPNAPTLTAVDNDTIGVEWTLNSSDEEDVIVELEAGESGTFAIEAVLEPQTETYTKSNALDGQHYVARITVETEDESSTSDESEFIITDLPGVEDLTAESVEVSE